ncbi:MAG: hypothetical protein GY700_11155, partial [Propionibacteriaceae bacterium]|nr:hypothetical protein [Propionibacteriaceae bacterium]
MRRPDQPCGVVLSSDWYLLSDTSALLGLGSLIRTIPEDIVIAARRGRESEDWIRLHDKLSSTVRNIERDILTLNLREHNIRHDIIGPAEPPNWALPVPTCFVYDVPPPQSEFPSLVEGTIAWTDGSADKRGLSAGSGVFISRGAGLVPPVDAPNTMLLSKRTHGLQTNNRGELYAILLALKHTRDAPVMIVVDSEYSLRVIQQASTRPCAINKDIIDGITQELEARCHRVVFVRTPSHCASKGIQPNALSRGNDIADLAADGGRLRSAATPQMDPEAPRRH